MAEIIEFLVIPRSDKKISIHCDIMERLKVTSGVHFPTP